METIKDRNIFCFTSPAMEMFSLIGYNTEFRMLRNVVLWRLMYLCLMDILEKIKYAGKYKVSHTITVKKH